MDRILEYISKFLAVMLVLPLHEFAHGFVAVKCGDPSPKIYGRYTLNPFAHFDTVGLICFVLAGFGWAKPVPINPNNFRKYKSGCFFTSIAGVVANYLTAFIVLPLYILAFLYVPVFGYFTDVLVMTLRYAYVMSLSFCVFNLLPIYPLDGFRVVDVFSKRRSKIYWFLRNYGSYILLALFALGVVADFTGVTHLDILGNVIYYVVGLIEKPITLFWGLIFNG